MLVACMVLHVTWNIRVHALLEHALLVLPKQRSKMRTVLQECRIALGTLAGKVVEPVPSDNLMAGSHVETALHTYNEPIYSYTQA